MVNTLAELGFELGVKHFIDASATKGILNRTGNGKVKHLTVWQLWIQEALERMGIKVVKIPRALNCADLLTRCNSGKEMREHMEIMNFGRWYWKFYVDYCGVLCGSEDYLRADCGEDVFGCSGSSGSF